MTPRFFQKKNFSAQLKNHDTLLMKIGIALLKKKLVLENIKSNYFQLFFSDKKPLEPDNSLNGHCAEFRDVKWVIIFQITQNP